MEGLGTVFSFGWLPSLLNLDLSDNPLGPSGLRAFARGLSSSPQSLPLQSLKLARTKAKAEGVEALAEALKAKTVPDLRVLMLKNNRLANLAPGERDDAPIAELLSTSALKELEELHLNENSLFDERLAGGEEGEGEGGEGGEGEVFQASAAALAVPGRFPNLRRLDLGGRLYSSMRSEQFLAFATGLGVGGLPSLQELVIPRWASLGNPSTEGVVALANALSSGQLSQLRDLQIEARDDMTSDAFATLSRSLATGKAPLLQSLDLQMWNENAEGGVEALAEGLPRGGLSSLTSFRLDARDMFCTKGYALSTLGLAFGGNGGCPALQKLDLEWDEEGDEGVGGLAEGLGSGELSSLRDLSLRVTCNQDGEGELSGEGCVALGEVLSTGKVPSLRNVSLVWWCNQSFVSLCEGLSRGSVDPPVMVDLGIDVKFGEGENTDLGVTRFAEVVRAGKLSGLRNVNVLGYGYELLSRAGGRALGEALTHADASLNSLEKLCIPCQTEEVTAAFLEGLARGPGRLPALHTLWCPGIRSIRTQGAQSLSNLVRRGKVPSIKELRVNLAGIGQEGMQAFAAALNTSHASALRRLEIIFPGVSPADAAAEVGLFSVALSSTGWRNFGLGVFG
eukprot:Cvel_15673.t2-p1 / transcript=Cvel_15673.t2 / gene=Cvel_15673 / organism=Chromera_velia_CCMP2878 / gene_product=hypothetical protein / transcript_product=hypothetical protein / location=Cvel_scaffold1170:13702-15567(+) / protein_length=622 / sequence_SO=supercontig / SO=protein_coding / is_pseudo=false